MNGDDDSVLFRDSGGYMSDDQLDYNAVDRNDGTLNDEDMLMEAVRSANEMIASEGLGNMADIDFKQRLAAAERAFQQQASGAGSDTLEGWSSDAESEDLPLATQKNLAISKATSRRRSASARPVNYKEDAMDTDNPADFIPDSLVDDDEDSNYEGFDDDDLPTSSDDDEYHMMDIEASARRAAGFARKGRGARGKKNRKRGRTMDPTYRIEVQRALGVANQYYVAHELANAYSQFGEAIRLEPTCAPAWKTMALIREEEGNSKAARQLYTVAAHLTPTDAHLWERLYSMYLMAATETEEPAKAGDPASKAMFNDATKHALYCLGFIIRHNPQDKTALWRKLDMLKKVGDYKGMAAMYRTMLKNDPYNMEAIRQATLVYAKRRNDVDTPIKWFSEAFSFYNCQAVKSTEEAIAQISAGRGGRGKHARADDSGSESDSDYNSDSDGDRNGGFDGSESWAEYYRSNPESTVPMEEVGGYTYSDLNIIAELRILRQEYEAAISDVKRGARFIQGRGRAKHWEDKELKDEFDLEYPPIPESDGETHNALPIELRVRLGQCRFLLGQRDSAQAHFASLFAFGVPGYQDLFADVGETYMESGNYELAIQVYNLMCNCGEADEPSTWDKLAKCYREIHDFEMACEYANRVIEADENDVEMLIWLGDLYEDMGLLDKAMDTINKAEKAEDRVRAAAEIAAAATEMSNSWTGADAAKLAEHGGATQLSPAVEIWEDRDQVVQIDTRKPSERTLRRRKDDNEQTQRHLHAMRNAEVAFKKLDLLKPQIDKDQDPNAVAEYCRSAARLFNDWNTIHAFYMTDRAKPFRNYRNHLLTSLENGTKSGGVDIQSSSAGQVAVRRELDTRRKRISKKQNHKTPHVIDKDEAGIPTTFRGILFDQWFDMFLMYGKCLSLSGKAEEAIEMLERVADSSVYRHERSRVRVIRLIILAVALKGNTIHQFYNQAHWWCGTKPTVGVIYKLVAYLMATSVGAMTMLTASNMYKFMRRQLEQIDDIYYQKCTTNEVSIPDDLPIFGTVPDLSKQTVGNNLDQRALTRNDVAAVHSMAAHIMTVARPEKASVTQYSMALALVPCDASLALHTGVSYLVHAGKSETRIKHARSRQRSVMKGLMYLERYAELRYIEEKKAAGEYDSDGAGEQGDLNAVVTQEIAYNFARTFQYFGLSELAAEYYQRVFALPISRLAESGDGEEASVCDLRREAAYNLANLYIGSGAVLKARDILKKYCTID